MGNLLRNTETANWTEDVTYAYPTSSLSKQRFTAAGTVQWWVEIYRTSFRYNRFDGLVIDRKIGTDLLSFRNFVRCLLERICKFVVSSWGLIFGRFEALSWSFWGFNDGWPEIIGRKKFELLSNGVFIPADNIQLLFCMVRYITYYILELL